MKFLKGLYIVRGDFYNLAGTKGRVQKNTKMYVYFTPITTILFIVFGYQ